MSAGEAVGPSRDAWDPEQYERFASERAQPFYDLLGLVQPVPDGRVVDLGCGTGTLTAELHRRVTARSTLGIDTSAAMLALAAAIAAASPGLRFARKDIAELAREAPPRGDPGEEGATFDVVFANASLQWLPDHAGLVARLSDLLAPGGQLAVQVPANADHASHRIAGEIAAESPFLEFFAGEPPTDPVLGVLAPQVYAELLYQLGFVQQHVRLQVYGHVLSSSGDVVEWVKGTALTRFRTSMPEELYRSFVERYTERLLGAVGSQAPYFFAFKRILMWARLG
jgi:trans-aconitate 2-methyltransferase